MVSSWIFFWLVGGDIIWNQPHQPSGSNKSGIYLLVNRRQLASPTWGGFQYLQISSRYCSVYPLRGNQDPAPRLHYCFSWLLLLCLHIPSFPWLATVWTCPLEFREGHGGRMKTIFCNQEMRDSEKLCAQEPHRVLLGFKLSCCPPSETLVHWLVLLHPHPHSSPQPTPLLLETLLLTSGEPKFLLLTAASWKSSLLYSAPMAPTSKVQVTLQRVVVNPRTLNLAGAGTWVWVLTLPLAGYVTQNKLFDLSELIFLLYEIEMITESSLKGCMRIKWKTIN